MSNRITTELVPPSRKRPGDFAVEQDTFNAALPAWATEANSLGDEVNENAQNLQTAVDAAEAITKGTGLHRPILCRPL